MHHKIIQKNMATLFQHFNDNFVIIFYKPNVFNDLFITIFIIDVNVEYIVTKPFLYEWIIITY